VASTQGVEASGLGNPTIKMDRKRWFPSHIPVTSKETQIARDPCMGVGSAVLKLVFSIV